MTAEAIPFLIVFLLIGWLPLCALAWLAGGGTIIKPPKDRRSA